MPELEVIDTDDSFEALRNRISEMLNSENGENDTYYWIKNTFPDCVIVEDSESGVLLEIPYVEMEGNIILGTPKEVDQVYVSIKSSSHEMTGVIVMKSATQKIAYAAVLVPDEADSDGDVLTAEKIERVAHEWMASYRNVDIQHTLNNVAVPVESYILPMPMYAGDMFLPKGTWILASKVLCATTWDAVEKGELTGYSVMGIRRTILDDAAMKSQDVALKKTMLKDLGEDWVACAVSFVDTPAVPKAKFFALKSKEKGVLGKIKDIVNKSKVAKAPDHLESANKEGDTKQESTNTSTPVDVPKEDNSSMGDEDKDFAALKAENDKLKTENEALKSGVGELRSDVDALKSAVFAKKAAEGTPEGVPEGSAGTGETDPEGGCVGGACGVEGATIDDVPDGEGEGGEVDAEKEALKSQVADLQKQVAKKSATSQSLKGQDGDGATSKPTFDTGRDVHGRRRR